MRFSINQQIAFKDMEKIFGKPVDEISFNELDPLPDMKSMITIYGGPDTTAPLGKHQRRRLLYQLWLISRVRIRIEVDAYNAWDAKELGRHHAAA
jgi:hypothetical protein